MERLFIGHGRTLRFAALLAAALVVESCATGRPLAHPDSDAARHESAGSHAATGAPRASSHRGAASQDDASAKHLELGATTASLDKDIARRAEAMDSGPIGSRASELASLRLVAVAIDLVGSGSLEGARVALERAVSLDGRNGYAYLWLAYVASLDGRDGRKALELARRDLPDDRRVRADLDDVARAVEAASAPR